MMRCAALALVRYLSVCDGWGRMKPIPSSPGLSAAWLLALAHWQLLEMAGGQWEMG